MQMILTYRIHFFLECVENVFENYFSALFLYLMLTEFDIIFFIENNF